MECNDVRYFKVRSLNVGFPARDTYYRFKNGIMEGYVNNDGKWMTLQSYFDEADCINTIKVRLHSGEWSEVTKEDFLGHLLLRELIK